MPYVVTEDEVTVLKALSEWTNPATGDVLYDHTAATYVKGTVLADEDVSPVVQAGVKDGSNTSLEYVKSEPKDGDPARSLQSIVPTPVESASPGNVIVDEEAAKVPDPPGAEIDQLQYAPLIEASNPGRIQVDVAAEAVPDPARGGVTEEAAIPGTPEPSDETASSSKKK